MVADKKIYSIDFKIIDVFLEAARYKSFREAESNGRFTQARITQCMDQLEEFLGIDLFIRNEHGRRRASLTPKGREFRDQAKRVLRMLREMEGMFRDSSTVRGIVRVGVSESIVHTWLPALLKQVQADYPNLAIEIEVDISPKLRDLLLAGEVDLAFLLGPIDVAGLHARPLCKFPVAFMATRAVEPRESITLEDIVRKNHRIITFARNTQPYAALRDAVKDRELHATIWASASLETVVRLALEHLGIAMVPPDVLKKRVGTPSRLRRLSVDVDLPDLDYVVSWPVASRSADDNTVQKVIAIAMKVAREWSAPE